MRALRFIVFLTSAVVCVTLLALVGCTRQADPWEGKPGKHVLTSFTPLYCFAQNVAGPDATVECVMTNRGPHHFDSRPSDALLVKHADIFFINGLELDEQIAEKLKEGAGNKDLKIVEVAEAIPEKQLRESGEQHGAEEPGHAHDHHHGKFDPHVWLGVPEAIIMVGKIRDELKELDPPHAAGYDSRAAAYIERLKQLQAEGESMLKDKKERKIVTFHDSMFYFARTYGLEIADFIEISPGAEASSKKIRQVVESCKKNGVRLITVEPQYPSNTSASAILNELRAQGIDAQFVEIDPLETARPDDLKPTYYEDRMRANLKQLAEKMR
ncbi:MAG TPA: metal ABC transporter substrate-binding protein [Gemmataceae bacterium]|jgi:ABC-type Zn uptake system ZnuABC Zn-binding protein ZnuA|nr:metal ABC transporter substrate-binding protein [Gemmataceae bacterium]